MIKLDAKFRNKQQILICDIPKWEEKREIEEICKKYFDLSRDYTKIKEIISKNDENRKEYGWN